MRSFVLLVFTLGVCLYKTEATLRTIFLDDLCSNSKSSTINLLYVPAGILISSPPRDLKPFDCTVTILPQFRHSVVLSIYNYYVGSGNELTIEDSDRHKIALLGLRSFEDEKKSIISEGRMIIHYKRKKVEPIFEAVAANGTAQTWTAPGFQFTFTQVRSGPCRDKEFTCDNGKCLPEKYVCNGHNHCGDNSNQDNCYVKKTLPTKQTPKLNSNLPIVWISVLVAGGTAVFVLIIVYIVVLIRHSKSKKTSVPSPTGNSNVGGNNVPLQSVSSTVPASQPVPPATSATPAPVSNGQPPSSSLYDRVRRSLRRPTGTRVNEPVQQQGTESYQVPSMYPSLDHIPSAPELHGADNPDFKIEE